MQPTKKTQKNIKFMENDKIRWLGKEKNAKCNEKLQNS